LARFMELALYCPNSGYYEKGGTLIADRGSQILEYCNPNSAIGRNGDFYTSVSTGSLFGEMLAFQFAQWLEGLPIADRGLPNSDYLNQNSEILHLVEAGAHDGQLALDILNWLKRYQPRLLNKLEYWLIEPSPQRQIWQRARLEQFAGMVRWAHSLQALPAGAINGVIFSNELLDAFPVHRLVWDRTYTQWIEWGVGISNDQFSWSPLHGVERDWSTELTQAGFGLSPELKAILPDGFIIEHCPAAGSWWRQAAAALRQGRLLTIDYGLTAQQFLLPERRQGTLRAYRHHQPIHDVLANPGEQDLTAHVNFTQLQKTGEEEGLQTDGFLTQSQFLSTIAVKMWSKGTGAPSASQARQFQTLTHPEHLGRSFRVLIQSRNC